MTGHKQSERQVVITGLGVVSPIGLSLEDFTRNLREAQSGIRPVTTLAYTPAPHHIAGEIRDFNPSSFAKSREQKKAIRVRAKDVYRLDMKGRCPELDWEHRIAIDSRGSSSICSAIDATVLVKNPIGVSRCSVETLTRLTPEEIAALPKKSRP